MSIVNWKAFIRDAQSPTTPLTEASEPSWFGFTKKFGLNQTQRINATTILRNQPFATQTTRTGVQVCL